MVEPHEDHGSNPPEILKKILLYRLMTMIYLMFLSMTSFQKSLLLIPMLNRMMVFTFFTLIILVFLSINSLKKFNGVDLKFLSDLLISNYDSALI